MRVATYFVAVTLDGFIADPAGRWDDFLGEGDHVQAQLREYPETLPVHVHHALGLASTRDHFDTVLMGWHTYTPALDAGIASPYPHLRQYVASRHEREVGEGMTVTPDPLGTLRELKAEPTGTGIWIAGGGTLASAVVEEIDRLVLKVHPVLFGTGIPLFASREYHARHFDFVRARPFDSGVVFLEYAR